MLISIIVQGRLHGFALAKALLEQQAKVQLITNYPKFVVERFGVPGRVVRSLPAMGLLHRYAARWDLMSRSHALEKFLHAGFSRWAAHQLPRTEPLIVYPFSGVALDLLQQLPTFVHPVISILARGSGHIVSQYHDLARESRRAGSPIERPSPWMIRREVCEYRQSDLVMTLSSFARDSFLRRGYKKEKILLLPLGGNVVQFRPSAEKLAERRQRILSGRPLTALYTGNVSLQKGIIDLIAMAEAMKGRIRFRVVGNITHDAAERVHAAGGLLEVIPRQPEERLPGFYEDADLYVFPTLHDGFAMVLAQARAACLPILATDHCAAPDMVSHGIDGWVFPVRRPDLFCEKLAECDKNRELLAGMVETLWHDAKLRDWSAVATDFLMLVREAAARHPQRASFQAC